MSQHASRDAITIVGGGLAGLTAAIACAEEGAKVRLLEAHEHARRARAQRPRALQSEPRPARPLQRRPAVAVAARSATCCPRTSDRRSSGARLRWQGALRRTPPLGAIPSRAAPARSRGARRARLPQLGDQPHRRAHRRAALGRRRRLHLPPRSRRAVGGVRVAAHRAPAARPPPGRVRYPIGGWSALVATLERRVRELGVDDRDRHAASRSCPRRR